MLEHWHTGAMTRRSSVLDDLEPEMRADGERAERTVGDGDEHGSSLLGPSGHRDQRPLVPVDVDRQQHVAGFELGQGSPDGDFRPGDQRHAGPQLTQLPGQHRGEPYLHSETHWPSIVCCESTICMPAICALVRTVAE